MCNEKTWLFKVYTGLYYLVMWDYNEALYRIPIKLPGFNGKYPRVIFGNDHKKSPFWYKLGPLAVIHGIV